jgi:hypothetical protein
MPESIFEDNIDNEKEENINNEKANTSQDYDRIH